MHSLLHIAAHMLTLATLARANLRDEASQRTATRESAVVAAAMHGLLSPDELDRLPMVAFTTPARLLAWACASLACRTLGWQTTPHHARYLLATVPRLEMALHEWADLLHMAEVELDLAAALEPADNAVDELLEGEDTRGQVALESLIPIMTSLDQGKPLPDTASKLREIADLLEPVQPISTKALRAA